MPIHNMKYESGVFFTKQVGYVDNVDARMWQNALKKHANNNELSIVAVLDMRDVERLCPTVVKAFSTALTFSNVSGIVIVAGELMSSRNARVLSSLHDLGGVRIVSSMDQAQAFANSHLAPSFGFSGVLSFRMAYI